MHVGQACPTRSRPTLLRMPNTLPKAGLLRRSLLKATVVVLASAATTLAWNRFGSRTSPAARRIFLQPLGADAPQADAARVRSALMAVYGIPVAILPARPLPERAFYPARHRYRADRLLVDLGSLLPSDGSMILGLTSADISTTKGQVADWGVLGLARTGGTAGIVSSFRCKAGARNAAHVLERLAKVAVHEAGHCLGLSHCPTTGCVMHDAEGTISNVDASNDVCDVCRAKLLASGVHVSAKRVDPWA